MPEFRLTITTAALMDIEEAMDWYFNQQIGLDTRFFNILKSTYQLILKNPELYGYYGNSEFVRRYKMKRFPFYIFYSIVESNTVEIIGIIHTSRSDEFIKRRIS